MQQQPLDEVHDYEFWTWNDHVPGPMIRAREGDILEVTHINEDICGIPHNIDFHSAVGPGGGGPLLTAEKMQSKTARFKLMHPGLFVYHCAVGPIVAHVANGMHGLILVEPKGGMPPVD